MREVAKAAWNYLMIVLISSTATVWLVCYTLEQTGVFEPSTWQKIHQFQKTNTGPSIDTLVYKYSRQSIADSVRNQASCNLSQKHWLACAVYFEARNQSRAGQYWVAYVVLHRMSDPRWPNTIEGVVRQDEGKRHGCQYSFICDGKPEQINDLMAWAQALEIAELAIADFRRSGPKLSCALYYHATDMTNRKAAAWFATLTRDKQIGDHIFYCDKPKTLATNKGGVAHRS